MPNGWRNLSQCLDFSFSLFFFYLRKMIKKFFELCWSHKRIGNDADKTITASLGFAVIIIVFAQVPISRLKKGFFNSQCTTIIIDYGNFYYTTLRLFVELNFRPFLCEILFHFLVFVVFDSMSWRTIAFVYKVLSWRRRRKEAKKKTLFHWILFSIK